MEQGIHNLSAEQYHADPCVEPSLSSGIGKILVQESPRHAWIAHPRLNPNHNPIDSSRFDLGSAAHELILEGTQAKVCVIDADDWRTKAAKEKRDEARANGLFPILAKHNIALTQMVDVAKRFIDSSPLKGILQGKPEQSVIWKDEGIWCRCRPDIVGNVMLDYKTTDSAEPSTFERGMSSLSYDFQAGFYRRGWTAVTGERIRFVFLAQEITPPYACSLVEMSEAYFEIADAKVSKAIKLWGDCLRNDRWPAYPAVIHQATPPMWAMKQHEQNLVDGVYNSLGA